MCDDAGTIVICCEPLRDCGTLHVVKMTICASTLRLEQFVSLLLRPLALFNALCLGRKGEANIVIFARDGR